MGVIFREIIYGSSEYTKECELRQEILRKPLGLDLYSEKLEEANQIHFGVFEQETLLACLIVVPVSSEVVKIRQMAVRQDQQGRGIGRMIMTEAENKLKGKGVKKIILNARKSALPFYSKLGYTVTSEEFIEVTILHYSMSKII